MSVYLYPYNSGSQSAKALSHALNIKRIKRQGSSYIPKDEDVIINWGNSNLPNLYPCTIINEPALVSTVTNKLSFFQYLTANQSNFIVPWTSDKDQVKQWLTAGQTVVARTKLTGHSGEGIVLLEGVDTEIVEAPLYTLYVPKKEEYRIHCCLRAGGLTGTHPAIFDVQRKARKNDVSNENVNWRVRNLAGGFIYARQDVALPSCVEECALKVFEATGLDFGAIDIIYNDKQNRAYALEVNTAPGLSGTTLTKYVEMFKELLEL